MLSESPNPGEASNRVDLISWLWPYCDHEHAAVMYPHSGGKDSTGWLHNKEDVQRAVKAFVEGTLESERFETATKEGKSYTIHGATRLGLVPHRDSVVTVFCLDLDDHTGDGGNAHLRATLSKFFGVFTVLFTSKGGKGFHCFFKLKEPMAVRDFVAWSKAWGFNRLGEPEVFPKTEKLTQVWLPGEPNEQGGDRYISGDFESCVIDELPEAPTEHLTSTTLRFLRGQQTQPGRNEALNKAAFELGKKRVDCTQAWTLCERGSRLCGLEPDETRTTFESGYKAGMQAEPQLPTNSTNQATTGGSAIQYSLDGIGNGERFVSMHGQDARYCYKLKEWYVWDTTRWAVRRDRVEGMAKLAACSIEDEMHAVCGQGDGANAELRKKYGRHLRSTSTKRGLDEILYIARSEPGMSIDVGKLDGDPMLFNCKNGTIDLKTGTMRKHARSDMLTKISPVRYDPDAPCPRWLAFLDRVFGSDQELIGYMQRAAGYALTGDTSEQCLFFMHGLGCNGKSVFASVLLHVLGDYGQRAPAEIIMRQERSSASSPSPYIARLRGVRLAVTSELEDQQRFGEAKVKDLTGGDKIVGRALHKDPIEFDPTHKLLLYGNHKPSISGTDHGIWRRIRLIPFEVTIPESERDPHLIDALKAEASGILAWLVEGCTRWQRDGLGIPNAVSQATNTFRGESDQVGKFIEECCVKACGVSIPKGELHTAFASWCTASGEPYLSSKAFSMRLKSTGFGEARSRTAREWIGLELIGDQR